MRQKNHLVELMNTDAGFSQAEYQALAELRYQLRRFSSFSERNARIFGLEPQQHQLLLAIKGLPDSKRASIGELAERLQLRHHSTVGLINRMEERGLIERQRDTGNQRRVLIGLTASGEEVLRKLSLLHQIELRAAGPALVHALNILMESQGSSIQK